MPLRRESVVLGGFVEDLPHPRPDCSLTGTVSHLTSHNAVTVEERVVRWLTALVDPKHAHWAFCVCCPNSLMSQGVRLPARRRRDSDGLPRIVPGVVGEAAPDREKLVDLDPRAHDSECGDAFGCGQRALVRARSGATGHMDTLGQMPRVLLAYARSREVL